MKPFLIISFSIFHLLLSRITVLAQPTISSFTPTSGSVGSLVTITGTNLNNLTSISIGGVSALRISNTGTSLVAMVMPGTTTGLISVVTANGSTNSTGNFAVLTYTIPNNQQGSKLSVLAESLLLAMSVGRTLR